MEPTDYLLTWLSDSGYLVVLRSDRSVSDAQTWKCECESIHGDPRLTTWGMYPREAVLRAVKIVSERRANATRCGHTQREREDDRAYSKTVVL